MNTATKGRTVVHIIPGHAYELIADFDLNSDQGSISRRRKTKPLCQTGTRFVCMADEEETYLKTAGQHAVHLQGDSLARALPMLVEVEPSLEEVSMAIWQRPDDMLKQLLLHGVLTIDQVRTAALLARAHFDARCEEERQAEAELLAQQ